LLCILWNVRHINLVRITLVYKNGTQKILRGNYFVSYANIHIIQPYDLETRSVLSRIEFKFHHAHLLPHGKRTRFFWDGKSLDSTLTVPQINHIHVHLHIPIHTEIPHYMMLKQS